MHFRQFTFFMLLKWHFKVKVIKLSQILKEKKYLFGSFEHVIVKRNVLQRNHIGGQFIRCGPF